MQHVYEFFGNLDDCIKKREEFFKLHDIIDVNLEQWMHSRKYNMEITWDDGIDYPPSNLVFVEKSDGTYWIVGERDPKTYKTNHYDEPILWDKKKNK
jgi:hypothetical protein